MFVKKVKRKCSVRGCKNTDCFAISRTREVGNTVIICKSCLGKALGAIDEVNPETKSNIPVNNAPAPALFYNAQALGIDKKAVSNIPPASLEEAGTDDVTPPAESVTPPASPEDVNEETETDAEPTPSTDEYICPQCGRAFDSGKGLSTHLRYCKGQSEE